jgi:hypothetical protein
VGVGVPVGVGVLGVGVVGVSLPVPVIHSPPKTNSITTTNSTIIANSTVKIDMMKSPPTTSKGIPLVIFTPVKEVVAIILGIITTIDKNNIFLTPQMPLVIFPWMKVLPISSYMITVFPMSGLDLRGSCAKALAVVIYHQVRRKRIMILL